MSLLSADYGATTARARAARAWWWRHPELPAVTVIVVSWFALGVIHWSNHEALAAAPWSFSIGAWALMTAAMMLPGSLPMLRQVAFTSLWPRRHRGATLFAVAYVGAWTAVAAIAAGLVWLVEATTALRFDPGPFAVAATLLLAAGWQLTRTKQRCLRRCHLRTPLAARGLAADKSIVSYGLFHARACIGSCGVIMAAMFVGAHDFHLMAPLAAITIAERYQPRPNKVASAVAIVAVAGLTMVTL